MREGRSLFGGVTVYSPQIFLERCPTWLFPSFYCLYCSDYDEPLYLCLVLFLDLWIAMQILWVKSWVVWDNILRKTKYWNINFVIFFVYVAEPIFMMNNSIAPSVFSWPYIMYYFHDYIYIYIYIYIYLYR